MIAHPPRKHLVLLGAGRAHLQVLKGLARQGAGDINVTLVAPLPYYIETAMLPGYLAGGYPLQDIRVQLDGLLEASGAGFVPGQVHALDPVERRVHLSSGDALPYDVLSIDVEPAVNYNDIENRIPGVCHNTLFTRPLENFIQLWPQLQALAHTRPLQVAVIGNGLPSAELAMAAAHALSAPYGSRITLLAGYTPLLAEQPLTLQRRVLGRLKALNVSVLQDHCVGIDSQTLQLACGASLACDASILAIGDDTPGWLLQSGVQVSLTGAPVVNARLQSENYPQVFVAPPEAHSEVGAVLEANLRAAMGSGTFRKAPIDISRLKVTACGYGYAIAVWGRLSLEGREVWHWKDRRDRRQLTALLTP